MLNHYETPKRVTENIQSYEDDTSCSLVSVSIYRNSYSKKVVQIALQYINPLALELDIYS